MLSTCLLQNEMQKQFEETSDDFTLERIINFGFDQHAEYINEVSSAATKELAIENSLKAISEAWETIELVMAPYKDKGHFKLA